MNEFEAIDEIVRTLGANSVGPHVQLGPGDDAAIISSPRGFDTVSSIDTLSEGVHFPLASDPKLIGYRSFMVSVSDLAAMGAEPSYAMVALILPDYPEIEWIKRLSEGFKEAADICEMPIVGGNLTYGKQFSISVSVHGWVPSGLALQRTGSKVGDMIYVSGRLGGAAAALEQCDLAGERAEGKLEPLASAFFKPKSRLDIGISLRGVANSAIDISDGLLKDLYSISVCSGVGMEIDSASVPVARGARLEQALYGGDDYELCFTGQMLPESLFSDIFCIGKVVSSSGIRVDGEEVSPGGYIHFSR